jgi:hypothetical protein
LKVQANNLIRNLRAPWSFDAQYVNCSTGGLLELRTRIGDLQVPLEIGRLENVSTTLHANIQFGRAGQHRSEDFVEVQFDGSPPIIRSVELGGPRAIAKGNKAVVTFRVSDYSGVDQVIYAFPPGGIRRLDDATATRQAVQTKRDQLQNHVFSISLDTKDMLAGKHLLVAKVVDLVGRESEIVSQELQIFEPKVVPIVYEIRGVVQAGRSAVNPNLVQMTVEGGEIGLRAVPIERDGSFVIPDLKPGEYTFKVKGIVGNRERTKEIKLKPTDTKLKTVQTIDVSG